MEPENSLIKTLEENAIEVLLNLKRTASINEK
jgi:hypothetical protein